MSEVGIVGAGPAGLACARVLADAGIEAVVWEASDAVGGRVRTDVIDGFVVDRGFQVYLTAYEEGRRFLDLDALDLRYFEPGADVWVEDGFHRVGDPFRRPRDAWPTLRAPIGGLGDKLRIARLRRRLGSASADELLESGDDSTTLAELQECGFSSTAIERFFRPLFAGILLDGDLETSARVFRFVFKMLASGRAAVPAGGMQRIPEQLAAGLPDGWIRLGTPVAEVGDGGVRLSTGESAKVRVVVVAAEAPAAARLLGVPDPGSRPVAGVAFAAEDSPRPGRRLMLDTGAGSPVNNVAVMSDVAPEYSPDHRSLIVVQSLDVGAGLEQRLRARLGDWFGGEVGEWDHLATRVIDHGHPDQRPPYPGRRPARLAEGLYVAGDHRASASIDGALRSGRRAAEAVIADLGV